MKDDKMALPTGVTRRGGVYWLRVLIPDDLRHLYHRTAGGKLATDRYRASLRTSDQGEAKVRALVLRAEFEREFVEKRKGLAPAPVKPTAALVALLCERIRHTVLANDDSRRFGLPNLGVPPPFDLISPIPEPLTGIDRLEHRQASEAVLSQALALTMAAGSTQVGRSAAEAEAKALGITIDWHGAEDALVHLTRATVAAYADVAKRGQGAVVETPAPPTRQVGAGATESNKKGQGKYNTVRDLLPLWKQKTKAAANAVSRTERALDLLDDAGVNTTLSKLSRADGAQFRDWLRDSEIRPFGQKTGRNHYRTITALLNASLDYGALPANPWQGLDFPVEDSEERPPFTRDELTRLFSGPIFESYAIPEGEKTAAAAAYWMPLLGLWTGARVGELAQLEVADVREVDGVSVLDIHERAAGSTLKNPKSNTRLIPIHNVLVRLGLLDYVNGLRDSGEVKLFPTLHRGGRRRPGEVFSEAFREYRTSRGVNTPLASFHSLRHNVRSALVTGGAEEPVCDDLLGHARTGSTGRRNYTHLELPKLQEGIERLAYPFLKLPRVYPAP